MKRLSLLVTIVLLCLTIPQVFASDIKVILKKLDLNKVSSKLLPRLYKASGKIVFVRQNDLWVSNADGKNERRLTKSRDCHEPSWDPTGTKIVYVRTKSKQYRPSGYLWCYDLKSASVKKIISSPKHCLPQWSPNGQWIAFLTEQPRISELTTYNLEVVTATGQSKKVIKRGVGSKGYGLAWSPDGRCLSYAAGEEPRVEIVELSGPAKSRVVYTSRIQSPFNFVSNLQWLSPTQILFVEHPINVQEGLGWKVVAVDPSSRRKRVIFSQESESGDDSCQYCFLGRDKVYWAASSHFTMGGESSDMTLYANGKEIARISNAQSPSWTPIK